MFFLGVQLFGRPSLPWGLGDLLDLPDQERAEYVTRLNDLARDLDRKSKR